MLLVSSNYRTTLRSSHMPPISTIPSLVSLAPPSLPLAVYHTIICRIWIHVGSVQSCTGAQLKRRCSNNW